MAEKKTSPWVYVGCGCLVVIALVVVGGIGGCWYLGKKAVEFGESMKDPEARTERALRVLGTDALPEGYSALFGFNFLSLFEIAVIGTGEVDPSGELSNRGEEGFIYLKMMKMGEGNEQEMRDFFEGRTNDLEALRNSNINVDVQQMIGRGTLQSREMALQYITSRGGVSIEGPSARGLVSIVLVGCTADAKQRIGIWYGPDPAPQASPEELDLTGSVGDESRIQGFFDGFDLCK